MNKQKILIGGAVLFSGVVLLVILSKVLMKPNSSGSTSVSPTEVVEEPIPTVDSSIKVDLTQQTASHDVILNISKIPDGTESIDYELSYSTKKQGLQGVMGKITVEEKQSLYEKKILLGTCSSGACVYHEVDGTIKLNLKFTGNYGERVFEKEYESN